MNRNIFGVFLVLHGLVHFLYIAISQEYIHDEGIHWTERSWLFSEFFSQNTVKRLAFVFYGISILLFLLAGIVVFMEIPNLKRSIFVAAIFSTITILSFWNGKLQNLSDQGFIGIALNLLILYTLERSPEFVGLNL